MPGLGGLTITARLSAWEDSLKDIPARLSAGAGWFNHCQPGSLPGQSGLTIFQPTQGLGWVVYHFQPSSVPGLNGLTTF